MKPILLIAAAIFLFMSCKSHDPEIDKQKKREEIVDLQKEVQYQINALKELARLSPNSDSATSYSKEVYKFKKMYDSLEWELKKY